MRFLFAGLLLVAAFAVSGCAPMGMSASVQLRSAPPPPSFAFDSEPRFNHLPRHNVSVIADESFGSDMFIYGGSYYLYNGGFWYRSQTPRGPFVAVEERRVPRPIFDVDDSQYRWRSHPNGWRGGQAQGRVRGEGDDRRGDAGGGPGR